MNLKESIDFFVEHNYEYYNQWSLDVPIILEQDYNEDLASLQRIMFKLIHEFVSNYDEYRFLMPLDKEVEDIIALFSTKEYRLGTYRTDFVFDDKDQAKLIEITCRFALNGIFQSAIFEKKSDNYLKERFSNKERVDDYKRIIDHILSYLDGTDSIIVLKGKDVKNESKIYTDIFERIGITVKDVDYRDIQHYLEDMKNSWVISELAFDEILKIPRDIIKSLVPMNIINDFRTVFLIHDKRFFDIMGHAALQEKALSKVERLFFDNYYIPTYSFDEQSSHWEDAKKNKDCWIIKHRALGKSQDIFAGIVTDEKEWSRIFKRADVKEMVLQKWVSQKTYPNTFKGKRIDDYVVGTLLFFDNHYFGLGEFRTSSFPVTNKVDHRKTSALVLKK